MNMITHEIIKPNPDIDIVIQIINDEITKQYNPSFLINGIPPHWHRSIEFSYVRKGTVNVWINKVLHTFHEGDFIFINSAEVHRLTTPDSKNLEVVLTIFPYATLQRFIPHIDSVTFDIYKNKNYHPRFYEIFDFFYHHALAPQNYDRLKMNSYIFEILHLLATEYQVMNNNPTTHKKIQHQILDYIENHYTDELSLHDLSHVFHMNPEYLSRRFKELFGINFKSYLNEYRLNASLNDVIHSQMSMQDIALKHGFSSVKSFIRIFKSYFHQTPYQYRLHYQKEYH